MWHIGIIYKAGSLIHLLLSQCLDSFINMDLYFDSTCDGQVVKLLDLRCIALDQFV